MNSFSQRGPLAATLGPLEQRALLSVTIIDDGDPGFSDAGPGGSAWTARTTGHGGDSLDANGVGNTTSPNRYASWTFSGLASGDYVVAGTWLGASTFASNTLFTISDGVTTLATYTANQQVNSAGFADAGSVWQSFGVINITTGTLVVQVNNQANGRVIADAIRIEQDFGPTNIALSNSSTPQNDWGGVFVGTLSTTDLMSSQHTYALVAGAGDADNAHFAINGNKLITLGGITRAVGETYTVRIKTMNLRGQSYEKTFAITVTAGDTTPANLAFSQTTVRQTGWSNSLVGVASSSVAGVRYTLNQGAGAANNDLFYINSKNEVRLSDKLTEPVGTVLTFRMRATRSNGQYLERVFAMTVIAGDMTDPGLALAGGTTAQTGWWGGLAGTLSTVLPAGRLTFSTGTGSLHNPLFRIKGNQLLFANAVTAPVGTVYSVRIRATNSLTEFTEQVFQITVTAGNTSSPGLEVTANPLAQTAWSNSVAGSIQTALLATSYSLAPVTSGVGKADNSLFVVTGNTVRFKGPVTAAIGTVYYVRIRATNAVGEYVEQTSAVTVSAGDLAAPAIPLSGGVLAENAGVDAEAGQLPTTVDGASSPLDYTLVSGLGATDNAKFRISGNRVLARASLNLELKPLYSIRVRATDSTGKTYEIVRTISVTDVNESPTRITLSSQTFVATTAVGSTVSTITAADPDAGDSHTFNLVSGFGSNSKFIVDGNQLKLASPLAAGAYSIRLRATDTGGRTFEMTFVLTVS